VASLFAHLHDEGSCSVAEGLLGDRVAVSFNDCVSIELSLDEVERLRADLKRVAKRLRNDKTKTKEQA
jgi:hypothetical protein